jgi:predicted negative regulator of RcsB-dependent stress response
VPKRQPTDTLEELESLGERLVGWIGANPVLVLTVAGGILLVAAGLGGWRAWQGSRADRAAASLAELRSKYVVAMGGTPNDVKIPEPANPETARSLRTEYVERFLEVARAHRGTAAAALAQLEASEIYAQLGNPDRALEVLKESVAELSADSPVAGILGSRIARLQEDAGHLEDAARSYEAAAAIPGYPLRTQALGDAARCWADAGKDDQAVALYAKLQSDPGEHHLAPHIEARLRELQAKP